MPRRRRVEIREVPQDPVYSSTLVEKFINSMMWQGKKTVAQGIFYDSMDKIRERSGDDPLKLFKKAVENVKPLLEVKTRGGGGANYQVCLEGQDPGSLGRRPVEAVQEGCRECQAAAGSEDAARGRRQLPGAHRGAE